MSAIYAGLEVFLIFHVISNLHTNLDNFSLNGWVVVSWTKKDKLPTTSSPLDFYNSAYGLTKDLEPNYICFRLSTYYNKLATATHLIHF